MVSQPMNRLMRSSRGAEDAVHTEVEGAKVVLLVDSVEHVVAEEDQGPLGNVIMNLPEPARLYRPTSVPTVVPRGIGNANVANGNPKGDR